TAFAAISLSVDQCGTNRCRGHGPFICSVSNTCLEKAVYPNRQQQLGQRYVGRWQLIQQENYVQFLQAEGVNPISVLLADQLRPQIVITNYGGNWKFVTEVVGTTTLTYDFYLDGDYIENTVDGRSLHYAFTMSRDGRLIQYRTKIDPNDRDSTFERYITGDKMICICETGGVIGKRIFQKIG
uniref:Lipocalin/cytosolic fatty-acid binding domain-containing protein n=1 Tax=Plectus sambesii TaxID=2011161 RepID=A0A914WWR4_9BILA